MTHWWACVEEAFTQRNMLIWRPILNICEEGASRTTRKPPIQPRRETTSLWVSSPKVEADMERHTSRRTERTQCSSC